MINTDRYEETLEDRMNKEFCNDIACGDMNKDLAIQYAHEFYGNALDLIAEVKRLREGIRQIIEYNEGVDADMFGSQVSDKLKEMIK